jgi:hypothetical protein
MPLPALPLDIQLTPETSDVDGRPSRFWKKDEGPSRVVVQELVLSQDGAVQSVPIMLQEYWLTEGVYEMTMQYKFDSLVIMPGPFVSCFFLSTQARTWLRRRLLFAVLLLSLGWLPIVTKVACRKTGSAARESLSRDRHRT